MNGAEEFIYSLEGEQLTLAKFLHELMMDQPGIYSKISFKIPFYYRKSWICYMNPLKKGGIEFVFTRGSELSDSQGILEARGRKIVRGIRLMRMEDIPEQALYELIQEAILLDESIPYDSPFFPDRKKN